MKAVIWDMDGVIIDSEPLHFEIDIQTMNYLGAQITKEQLERFVGMTNPEMWTIIKGEYGIAQTVIEIIEHQLSAKIHALSEMDIMPIDGVKELILDLKSRNIPMGIASSSPRLFIEEVLEKFQIREYFDCIVSGEEVKQGKPAPDVYLEAAQLLGVKPHECIVIEDSRNGIKAAKAARMKCIGYVNVNSGNQDLSAADRVVQSINDINFNSMMLDWKEETMLVDEIKLVEVKPEDSDLAYLISKLDAYLLERYPVDEVHVIDFEDPNVNEVSFVVAYYDESPVGCGAVRPLDSEYTELKRFYVEPQYRNKGIAGKIFTYLENKSRELNFRALRLETGEEQPEAISFYKKQGFYEIAKFGEYEDCELSVCFEKKLG